MDSSFLRHMPINIAIIKITVMTQVHIIVGTVRLAEERSRLPSVIHAALNSWLLRLGSRGLHFC